MAYAMPVQSDPTNVMGRRIVAYILDVVLASGVFVAVMALTKTASYVGAPPDACATLRLTQGDVSQCVQFGSHVYTWKSGAAAEAYGLSILVSFLNLVVLQGIGGASIGKLILGLRVVDAQGATCGVGRAIVRWLCLLVDSICGIVGLVIASVTHPHRRIGDMAAGTYVIGVANVGRPIVAAPPAYQYAYPQGGTPEWTPPGTVPPPAPGWGTAPPPAWGAPPPGQTPASPPPTAWGAPPPPPAPWGAPPPAADPGPPAWGAPAAAPAPAPAAPAEPRDRSGWGTPPSTWGAPETPAPAPTPEPPAPAPTPEPPAPQWSAPPPPPSEPQSGWGAPAAPAPAAPPTPEPPAPAAPTAPVAPSEQQSPPPAAPAASPAPADGESWWSKAFEAEDEDET